MFIKQVRSGCLVKLLYVPRYNTLFFLCFYACTIHFALYAGEVSIFAGMSKTWNVNPCPAELFQLYFPSSGIDDTISSSK